MNEEETIARLKKFDEPIIVCHHLLENPYLNLNFPDDIAYDEAWCDLCEELLQKEHGWTDKSLKFANLKACCKFCFTKVRERSGRS